MCAWAEPFHSLPPIDGLARQNWPLEVKRYERTQGIENFLLPALSPRLGVLRIQSLRSCSASQCPAENLNFKSNPSITFGVAMFAPDTHTHSKQSHKIPSGVGDKITTGPVNGRTRESSSTGSH